MKDSRRLESTEFGIYPESIRKVSEKYPKSIRMDQPHDDAFVVSEEQATPTIKLFEISIIHNNNNNINNIIIIINNNNNNSNSNNNNNNSNSNNNNNSKNNNNNNNERKFEFEAGMWLDMVVDGVKDMGGFSFCSSPMQFKQTGLYTSEIKMEMKKMRDEMRDKLS